MSETAFGVWFTEREGFSLRAERFDGDVAWLKAAFEAGRAAERERCAMIAELDVDWTEFQRRPKTNWKGDQTNVFAAPGDEHLPTPANVFAYTTGLAAGRAIASSIRSPHTTSEDRT